MFAQKATPQFKVLAFYTGINDLAHVSYVKEANHFFDSISVKKNFLYEATNDWDRLTSADLAKYDVVLFLDTRPEKPEQREGFQRYIEKGGGWIGFHFSAFALNGSSYQQDWNWYHETFLGSGEYAGNTWRPTAALLERVTKNKFTASLPFIKAQPNEWYKWTNDLRKNKNIEILYAIDKSSFPVGTGPKPNEIWKEGFYPIIWRNTQFNMIYSNMGHNDMDYEHKFDDTNRTLSHTFGSKSYAQFITNALFLLAKEKKRRFGEK